ncbi:MAG: iron-sulfur cluster carrier protein ApbC [Rhodocyclaceae bacterium]
MAQLDRQAVDAALAAYVEPHLECDLVSAGCIESVEIDGGRVALKVCLGFPARRLAARLREALAGTLAQLPGVTAVDVVVTSRIEPRAPDPADPVALPGVRNVLAVSSGKGGVGKSTTAVNLALALADEGARVGMLDADLYGPSLPRMLGIAGRPRSVDGKRFQPLMNYGLQAMSAGFLVDEEEPMIWRGSMVTQALEQLLRETEWKDLDYLVIDMPPGTGDVQLTLAQRVKLAGAVVVTTPQDIALLDATRGLKMFDKVGVPVLGVIENMGLHVCSHCGHAEHVFGDGGGLRMADRHTVDFLGSLPLDIRIREQADNGMPTVAADPDGALADAYREIARKMVARLSRRQAAARSAMPTITISDS